MIKIFATIVIILALTCPLASSQCPAGKFLEDSSNQSLTNIILNLVYNNKAIDIADQFPERFDFTEGEFGTHIVNGTSDMFNQGNFFSTDLITDPTYFIPYNRREAKNDITSLGPKGRYFTDKFMGLFVFMADLDGVSTFSVSGGLGADASGQVEGTVLTQTINGITYKGFVKRVFGTDKPSVNHLIVVEDNGSVGHTYATNPSDDGHTVTGLSGVKRLYYLLFASRKNGSGTKIDDSSMSNIMSTLITSLGLSRGCTGTCPVGCSVCSSPSQCTQCETGFSFNNGACKKTCPIGSTLNNYGQCQCDASGKFSEDSSNKVLTKILLSLNANHTAITGLIPNRVDFAEGLNGTHFIEGTLDMYDKGNFLSTDLVTWINYFISYAYITIRTDAHILGPNSNRYFTTDYLLLLLTLMELALSQSVEISELMATEK